MNANRVYGTVRCRSATWRGMMVVVWGEHRQLKSAGVGIVSQTGNFCSGAHIGSFARPGGNPAVFQNVLSQRRAQRRKESGAAESPGAGVHVGQTLLQRARNNFPKVVIRGKALPLVRLLAGLRGWRRTSYSPGRERGRGEDEDQDQDQESGLVAGRSRDLSHGRWTSDHQIDLPRSIVRNFVRGRAGDVGESSRDFLVPAF